ncbi:hypothetical protein [Uliginosibacterium gangwonense]|uniref:hypothetical protein n=1 Tax=Uliginosibacterium gangwonense TaxID=392736 RepID=UPI00035D35DA|nr:hypothetical protein [Uliginosibacterium gangwonense]
MSWVDFHSESERLAIEAQLKINERRMPEALLLYKAAAEAEQSALNCLEIAKARTRGITAVSAVALWFKAGEFAKAEQLAHLMLADSKMPEFARRDLKNLVQTISTEEAKREARVAFLRGHVLVSVKGGEVVTGGAPLDLVVDKVQTIQSMYYRTIEHLNGVPHRRSGPPSKELQASCRPWLFQQPPGSYQFSVAIQKPAQPDFFRQEVDPEEIAIRFLEIIRASASDDTALLNAIVPEEDYRTTFLKLARNLAPTGKAFERIELRTSGDGVKPVELQTESRTNIIKQIRQHENLTLLVPDSPPEILNLQGTLRAVHLDDDWLDLLLVDGKSVHVEGLGDAVDDLIGPMVNRPVVVRATRRITKEQSKNKYLFIDIELDE